MACGRYTQQHTFVRSRALIKQPAFAAGETSASRSWSELSVFTALIHCKILRWTEIK